MRKLINIAESFLFSLNILIVFLLIFENQLVIPSWLQVLGRMHPLFLHFPIVILLLSVALYIYQSFQKKVVSEGFVKGFMLVGAVTASLTIMMGLFLSKEEGYAGSTMFWHKWMGVGVGVLASGLYYYVYSSFPILIGRIGAGLIVICLVIAGHLGAELTHGENFLLAPVRFVNAETPVTLEEALVYDHIITPIIAEKCLSCHNPSKAKGNLVMTDQEGFLKGGKNGKLFEAGDPENSLIIQRFHLPLEDKKHMPPRNKPQLTDREVEILERWIRSGADMSKMVIDFPPDDTLRVLMEQRIQPREEVTYKFPAADERTIRQLNSAYRVVEPLSLNSPALSVNIYNASTYTGEVLEELSAVQKQVVNLDLNKMPVTDNDLKIISKFENLRRLNLNFTNITGATLHSLNNLRYLEYLSLSSTSVGARHLRALSDMPGLRKLYIWNTSLSQEELKNLQDELHHVVMETGFVADHSKILHLPPVRIENENKIYSSDFEITTTHPVKGAIIRYTLDGSEPDSINGLIYSGSIRAFSSVNILKTRAYKDGWYGSEIASAIFYKTSYTPDSVIMITLPERRYFARGAETLIDKESGVTSFGSREGWLGYREDPMVTMIEFKEPIDLQSVTLSTNNDLGAYIFPPVKIEVWGGKDKGHLSLLSVIHPEQPENYNSTLQKGVECKFKLQSLTHIKIIAEPVSKLPSWHQGKGQKGWLFVDEVLFN